jgi:sensor histidine kinase regulating citrate/malate metabolism
VRPYFLYLITPVTTVHFVGFSLVIVLIRKMAESIEQEAINTEVIRTEYNKILEKMPEGILIINKEGEIQLMNLELREVLNLQYADREEEKEGLEFKMFKKYNLVEELSSNQQEGEEE